ncbi:MAG: hypothetical protein ABFS14_06550 [Gemmatimonadota bacterium]
MRARTEPSTVAFSCYRFLLLAYPRGFRRKYGDEMASLFQDRYERGERSMVLTAGLWISTLADVGRNALFERFVSVGELRPRELAGAGSGAGASSLAGVAAYACICCVAPAAVALMGSTALFAGHDLLALRPQLLSASFVLVAASLWMAYSGPSAAYSGPRAAAEPGCQGGSCTLVRVSAWTASLMWLVGVLAPWWTELLHRHAHLL